MRLLAWLRRWPITTMLVAVILAQTCVIVAFGVTLAAIRADIDETAVAVEGRAVAAQDAAEQRAAAAQEASDARLRTAMGCLTGLLLIPPGERTDEVVHRVCSPDLIDGVRARLAHE